MDGGEFGETDRVSNTGHLDGFVEKRSVGWACSEL